MSLTYPQAVDYLFPRVSGGRTWSLGPTRRLLDAIGHPETEFRAIHVGGTNGKGSVAAMVAGVLRREGHDVGLYTSPHLVSVRERIAVNGRPITEEAFASWTTHLMPEIEATEASFYEATTAIAFADFAARNVDVGVIEVGLGGRLDSTNVLEPLVSGVTNVAMDHAEYLGDTLESIALEKAAIAKRGRPFIVGERDPQIAEVLRRRGDELGARVAVVPSDASYLGRLGFVGGFQRRNAAVAAALLAALPDDLQPNASSLALGFGDAWLPGRLDRRGRWLFDVAHNPAGMRSLADFIAEAALPGPVHAVFGVMADKARIEMLQTLSEAVDRVWVTTPPAAPVGRTEPPGSWVPQSGVTAAIEPEFERALRESERKAGTVVVTGSFYTVGGALSLLPGFRPVG